MYRNMQIRLSTKTLDIVKHVLKRAQVCGAGLGFCAVAGLLSLPLITTLALHPSQPLKAWAGHVLNCLCPAPGRPSKQPLQSADGEDVCFSAIFHGLPCLIQQSSRLLTQLWEFSGSLDNKAEKKKDNTVSASTHAEVISSPLVWLRQFRAALQRVRASDSSKTEANDLALHSQQDEVMRMILTALLDHPQPAVQAAAAAACGEAVQVFPICGISFLPLLMYKLQSSVTHSQHGKPIQH